MKAVDKVGNELITEAVGQETGPYLPTGAKVLTGSIDTGLVIEDSNKNEWVWIEVPKSIYDSTTKNTDYSAIQTAMQTYASSYRNSSYTDTWYSKAQHGLEQTQYQELKRSMLKSIFENGGFYIGRYEAGTNTARFASSDALTTPVIQRDKYPYNFVTCSQAQERATQLATGGKQASLMFGIQWDLVLKFMEEKGYLQDGTKVTQSMLKTNSGLWGNYSNVTFDVKRKQALYTTTPKTKGSWNGASSYTKPSSEVFLTTGATDRNSVLGIYDLAGNVVEWTLEYTGDATYPCAVRGGGCLYTGSSYPASSRYGDTTSNSSYGLVIRTALW